MKIFTVLLSIIGVVAATVFIVPFVVMMFAVGNTDSSTHIYTDFKCQGEIFSIQKELEQGKYFLDSYEMRNYDAGEPINVYPVGSEFKILRAHSSYNFSAGGMSTLLVEDENGNHGYIFLRDIDPKTCQMAYYYNPGERRISLRNSKEILAEDENITFKTPPPRDRDIWYEQLDDKNFVKSLFDNTDTVKPNLTLHLSSKRYWHYARKIIEKYREHLKSYDLFWKDDGTVMPYFTVGEKRFDAFSCDTDYADMYACFERDFPKWLKKPYVNTLPFVVSSALDIYEDIKNDELFPLIFYMKDFHYDTYRRVLFGRSRLNWEENSTMAPPRIGNKRFLLVGNRVISKKTKHSKEKRFYLSEGVSVVSRTGSRIENFFSGDYRLEERVSKFRFEESCGDPIFKYSTIEEARKRNKDLFIFFTKTKGCYAVKRIVEGHFPDLSNFAVVQLHQYTEEYDKYIKYFNVGDFEYNYIVVSSNELQKINESEAYLSSYNSKDVKNILK